MGHPGSVFQEIRLASRSCDALCHLWRLYIPSTAPINKNLFAWESASAVRTGYWGDLALMSLISESGSSAMQL